MKVIPEMTSYVKRGLLRSFVLVLSAVVTIVMLSLFSFGYWEAHRIEVLSDEPAEHATTQRGKSYVVVHIVTRGARGTAAGLCQGAKVSRLLVLFDGNNRIKVSIPLTYEGLANPQSGNKDYDSIYSLPAPLNPALKFYYRATTDTNCSAWESLAALVSDWAGTWAGSEVDIATRGKTLPANIIPVIVQDGPIKIDGIDVIDPDDARQ